MEIKKRITFYTYYGDSELLKEMLATNPATLQHNDVSINFFLSQDLKIP